MRKTILITGSTDGIGLETAKQLVSAGHHVLLHGRNADKLQAARKALPAIPKGGSVESWLADFSRISDVEKLAREVKKKHSTLDVVINNAGVLKASHTTTSDGLDVRFAVNTIAPYILTKHLLPLLGSSGRVVNVSSAAQAPVNMHALTGRKKLDNDMSAYAQSKLALMMWSNALAKASDAVIVSVNPGSMLGSKMVKEGFGVDGGDVRIGADILVRAALSDEFAKASGKYFDNDARRFGKPHADALAPDKAGRILRAVEEVVEKKSAGAASDHGSKRGRHSH